MLLSCENVTKRFGSGQSQQTVLDGISLSLKKGDSLALLGPSGSGKTTLLSILGCMLSPTEGKVFIDGKQVNFRRPWQLTSLRRNRIGFVFQQAQLLPFLTVYDNLALSARNAGLSWQARRTRINQLLDQLDIARIKNRYPNSASGGERQRVAVARFL